MSNTHEHAHDGADLKALRAEIDALKAIPEEEILNPLPHSFVVNEPTPVPTDAIGARRPRTPKD